MARSFDDPRLLTMKRAKVKTFRRRSTRRDIIRRRREGRIVVPELMSVEKIATDKFVRETVRRHASLLFGMGSFKRLESRRTPLAPLRGQ